MATAEMNRPLAPAQRTGRMRVEKIGARRIEIAEAALETLSELGYARTSLRDIAQKSEFTHGVFHYYFNDKNDLICCSVRHYKAKCVMRYDAVIAAAATSEALVEGFLAKLGETLRDEAHMHRLWYDLRSQALFEDAFREDVGIIDKSLEEMVWRVATRYAELAAVELGISSGALYALLDGLFQKYLLLHLSGQTDAVDRMLAEVRRVFPLLG